MYWLNKEMNEAERSIKQIFVQYRHLVPTDRRRTLLRELVSIRVGAGRACRRTADHLGSVVLDHERLLKLVVSCCNLAFYLSVKLVSKATQCAFLSLVTGFKLNKFPF